MPLIKLATVALVRLPTLIVLVYARLAFGLPNPSCARRGHRIAYRTLETPGAPLFQRNAGNAGQWTQGRLENLSLAQLKASRTGAILMARGRAPRTASTLISWNAVEFSGSARPEAGQCSATEKHWSAWRAGPAGEREPAPGAPADPATCQRVATVMVWRDCGTTTVS